MAEATIRFPNGETATLRGPDRETIERKARELKKAFRSQAQQRPEVIAPGVPQGEPQRGQTIPDLVGLPESAQPTPRTQAGEIPMFQRAVEEATGTQRGRGRLPELGGTEAGTRGQRARLGLGFLTTPDPEARKDMVRSVIPGTTFSEDEEGNTVVNLPSGQKAFLNAPGFSTQDFADFATDVVKFLPTARFAQGGKTLFRRIARAAGAGGATAAGEEVAAGAQGSEQGIRLSRIGGTGAITGGVETVTPAAALLGRVFRRTFGRRTGQIMDGGELTPAARSALERAGIDPDDISPELAESAIRLSEQGTAREGVTGVAQSQRFGVPMTRGQATGSFRQLAEEEQLRGRGDPAGDVIREFDQRQNQRLVAIDREIQEELGGGQPALAREAEGGARVRQITQEQADDLLLQIDDAFSAARGSEATLNREGLDRLRNATEIIEERGFPTRERLVPATNDALGEINRLTGDDITEQTMREIEQTRQRLIQLQGTAANPTDRNAVTLLKKRFDQYLTDAFDNALFTGDEEALNLLRRARNLRAEYGRRFEERTRRTRSGRRIPDPGGKAVESIVEKNPTDEGVVNMIFGRARLFNQENAARTVQALRNATDNDETVNATLKQLAFRRISSQAIDDGTFSPRKFVTAFNKAMEDNSTVMREIFSEDEIRTLREFRDTVRRLDTPRQARNPSGTASALLRAFSSIGQIVGLKTGGIGVGAVGGRIGRGLGGPIERGAARGRAFEAVNPQLLLPGRPSNRVIASGIAGVRQGGESAQEITRPREQIGRALGAVQ